MKKIKVTRIVEESKRDETNHPHVEVCVYDLEVACFQGFLCTMVDGDHYIEVREIDV